MIGLFSEPPYTRPISRSFQMNMNWKIASEASAGTESGSTSLANTVR